MNVVTMLLIGAFAAGATASSSPQIQQQEQTVIVVVGAGGTTEYAEQFAKWVALWQQACEEGGARYVAIGLDSDPNTTDRENLQKMLTDEAEQTTAALWLVLIGHGTFDGRTARFNLRGSDVSADELAQWLMPIVRPTAVINTASSSAPFLKKLSAPGRVVITATKSGFEQNYARFGGYLAGAIIDLQADLDKDGQVSLLEAFLTASHRVDEFYSAAGRLTTEHALLDDNGDSLGTPADWFRGIRPIKKAADDTLLDSYRAHQLHLHYSDNETSMPPELRARRDRLEIEVLKLRDNKQMFSEEEYFSKLEALLLEIAHIYKQTDEPQ